MNIFHTHKYNQANPFLGQDMYECECGDTATEQEVTDYHEYITQNLYESMVKEVRN